jgi:hypothetical protein
MLVIRYVFIHLLLILNFYDLSSPKGSSELNATSFLICCGIKI